MSSQFGKMLTIFGVLLIIMGLLVSYGKKIPFLNKLGHLPGDLVINTENFTLYIPWVTCLLISFVIYVILNVIRR